MKEGIIIFLVFLTFLLMFSNKTKDFVRRHKEVILAISYTFMSLWFSFILLRPNNFKIAFKYMKTKSAFYGIYMIIYIIIPAYFIYNAVKAYIDLYNKKKKKEEVKEIKEVKKEKTNKKKK